MTGRHPQTEGNDLRPRRVDAMVDVTVPDDEGGRRSLSGFKAEVDDQLDEIADKMRFERLRTMEGYAPGWSG